MLLQFFKHANGKFILLIFLFVFILRLGIGVFYNLDLLMVSLAYLAHSISAVFLNRIFTKNQLTKRYSILPAFIFILLTSTTHLATFNSLTIPFVLFCMALVGLSNIYPAEKVDERLFNSGLILSTTLAINPIVLFFTFPLIFVFQVIYGVNQLKRILITSTALLVPICIYFSFQFIVLNETSFLDRIFQSFQFDIKSVTVILIGLIYPLILCLLSLFDLQSNYQNKKVLSRKYILLTLVLGFIHGLLLIFTQIPLSASIFILLPITMLIANYFEHVKATWIHNLLFILLFFLSCGIPFLIR